MSSVTARALALLGAGFAVILLIGRWADDQISDIHLYSQYARIFLDGNLPYGDVAFEYPPLAALVIALPGILGTGEGTYEWTFAAAALALAVAMVVLCGRLAAATGGDPRRAMLAAAAAPLLTGAMIRTHFDLVPLVLLLGALLLLARGRPAAGLAVLGAGVVTKGFPLAAAPVALAWLWARHGRASAARGLAALVAVVASVSLVAVAISPSGALDAVQYHLDRPVQVESAPAIVLLAFDRAGAGSAETVDSFRSAGLEHQASGAVTALFAALMLAAIAWFTVAAARRDADARTLVLAALGAVAAFAAFGKVLSPQFLVWTIPLAALALAWRLYALAGTVAAATALTLVEFPSRYFDFVDRDPFPVAVVALRDLLLAVAVALAAVALSRRSPAPAAARSTSRARPRRPRPAPR